MKKLSTKISLIFGIFYLFIGFSATDLVSAQQGANKPPSPPGLAHQGKTKENILDHQNACQRDPIGEWKQFPNGCADYCGATWFPQICPAIETISCDCGPEHCWNGKQCLPRPVCGNGRCEIGESSENCLKDCLPPPICGNNLCEKGEDFICPPCLEQPCLLEPCTPGACPGDCNNPVCGNDLCEEGENNENCPNDCLSPAVCGNNICEKGEDFICPILPCLLEPCPLMYGPCISGTCPEDCNTPVCGNGQCEAGEDNSSCPNDCPSPPVCGNNICEEGEDIFCPPCLQEPCPLGPCIVGTCPDDCFFDEQNACQQDPIGEWKLFPDGCADYCGVDRANQFCLAMMTLSCDCGADYCWDGKQCVSSANLPVCGNGLCEQGEDRDNCLKDCHPFTECGNSICEEGEDVIYLPCFQEPCLSISYMPGTCPQDCGF